MFLNQFDDLAEKSLYSKKDLEKLFEKIYPLIWHYYKIRITNIDDAKDLTQNACIKVVSNLNKFDCKKGSFLPWMYKIIKNMLFDFFRIKKLPVEEIDLALLEGTYSPLKEIIKNEEKVKINEAVKKLGKRQKEIIEMKYFFKMKNKEIANVLNIKERTVGAMLVRTLEKLRFAFEDNFNRNGLNYEEN